FEPGAAQPDPGGLELARGAADIRAPSGRSFRRPEGEPVALAQIPGKDLDHIVVASLGGDLEAEIDREWEAEPAVVAGVLADRVDPAGGVGDDALGHGR